MKSLFLRLNKKDFRRALGLAIAASLAYLFGQMCFGIIPDVETLKAAGAVFAGTAGSYITKNLFTNSNDEFLKNEHGKYK
jgi:hypothetical protein